MKKINVLSLFDGISCGQVALERSRINVNKYFASEIDKYAIKITQKNYPNTMQLGDITRWKEWDIDFGKIDLILAGSPCQGFSFAGKQLAFNDPRSRLFFVFVDILNHIKSLNPNVRFLLENVRMKKEYLDIISKKVGVEPVMMNSSLVSAQNRVRYYWANWNFDQPEDKGILLRDILEDGYVEKSKSWCMLEAWNRFPTSKNSAIKRYKRSMMPIVFKNKNFNFDDGWRELTITECEKLQTITVGYTSNIPPKKAKGMLGNGWTVDVISHILNTNK